MCFGGIRNKFELAINDLSADIIKIQREEKDRKRRERIERERARQEARRQARLEAQRNNQQNTREYNTGEYSETTEEVAEEAIRENNILNTLTNITNIERPYEGLNEELDILLNDLQNLQEKFYKNLKSFLKKNI